MTHELPHPDVLRLMVNQNRTLERVAGALERLVLLKILELTEAGVSISDFLDSAQNLDRFIQHSQPGEKS